MNEQELKDFIEISRYAGQRFDLIQAGGGNSSVKNSDGTMYIKASGVYLSEVNEDSGYAIVKNKDLVKVLKTSELQNISNKKEREQLVNDCMKSVNLTANFRPSIETLLHSILKKYTLHTHPLMVNAITCRKDWKDVLNEIFSGVDFVCVDYNTPGIDLALELIKQIKNKDVNIIFLQNHGLIITADSKNEIYELTEFVVEKIEKYLNIDLSKYKLTTEISKILPQDLISYVSDDEFILKNINNQVINTLPFCPDKMVYCGILPLILQELSTDKITEYKNKYYEYPKVILYKDNIFFVAKNTKKAKEIEEVFKFHIMTLTSSHTKGINYLSQEEIQYIGNWEAEKYRQKI